MLGLRNWKAKYDPNRLTTNPRHVPTRKRPPIVSVLLPHLPTRATTTTTTLVVASSSANYRLANTSPTSMASTGNVLLATSSVPHVMESGAVRKNATLICVPIMAESVEEMVTQLDKAKSSGADLVEIRLDSLKNFSPHEDLKTLIKASALPTLFTYRPKWEGGQYDGDDNSRLDSLRLAMELGAD
ncbi:hypothetical protein BT93_L0549 [Corymbia citriodora subsp. variegata]|uniref:Uncharacterized protein n=1 Tax=Corymbia citriodora subsp. variegata TaxID=360336 RepID=A0A8T0CXK4_CORYI|nr:hypothetical protein BT93_L0549 [Corymbia citriodora subsp. variegata]